MQRSLVGRIELFDIAVAVALSPLAAVQLASLQRESIHRSVGQKQRLAHGHVEAPRCDVERHESVVIVQMLGVTKSRSGLGMPHDDLQAAGFVRLVGSSAVFLDQTMISEGVAQRGLDSEVEDRIAVRVLLPQIEALQNQLLQRLVLTGDERIVPLEGWSTAKRLHHVTLRRLVRLQPIPSSQLCISTPVDEQLRDREARALRCVVQRRHAKLVLGIDIGTALQEHDSDLHVAPDGRDVEAGLAEL
eukprot:7388453-Prymnesium_polylepis.1